MQLKPRTLVQIFFLILSIGSGFLLIDFLKQVTVANANATHPSGVEAFLPIGGLVGLKHWFLTGQHHLTHAAAPIFLGLFLLFSLFLKKSFCSWICPVGFISELSHKFGKKLFKKNWKPNKWLDPILKGIKYFLLGFFFWAIVIKMNQTQIDEFLNTDYWVIADIKMLRFFTQMSLAAALTILVLVLFSLPFKLFWCRYFCPYGALLGVVSYLSPFSVNRDKDKCTSCQKCTRNCPAYLPVAKSKRIISPECTSCLTCVEGCPHGALRYSFFSLKLNSKKIAAILLLVSISVFGLAKLNGHWDSNITASQLKQLLPNIDKIDHLREVK